jgi:hypothetical protein
MSEQPGQPKQLRIPLHALRKQPGRKRRRYRDERGNFHLTWEDVQELFDALAFAFSQEPAYPPSQYNYVSPLPAEAEQPEQPEQPESAR